MKQRPDNSLMIARKAFQNGDYRSSQHFFQLAAKQDPGNIEALVKLSTCASMLGQPRMARSHALDASRMLDQEPHWLAELAEQLSLVGESEAAFRLIQTLSPETAMPVLAKAGVAATLHRIVKLDEALIWIGQAASEVKNDARHSIVHAFHGEILRFHNRQQEAYAAYEKAIRLDPAYPQSYLGRGLVQRATAEFNHVDNLRKLLSRCKPNTRLEACASYALFKELDELGDYASAWPQLERGWRAKRTEKGYRVAEESMLFERLSALTNKLKSTEHSQTDEYPIPVFILGQPRSGSTLIERLLAQHPDVHAAGELFDFIQQLHWCADIPARGFVSIEAAERVATQDLSNLGERYLEHIKWRADGKKFVVDKLPPNYLLTAFIAKALPQAIIIHSVRDPMDTCYSQLKECFDHGYEHSYSPDDMANHYLGYRNFMESLQNAIPGRIHDCHHSEMIDEPSVGASLLFTACKLEFKNGYLSIETDKRPVSTASSAQVRSKINREGVGRWQPYADKLKGMQDKLGP